MHRLGAINRRLPTPPAHKRLLFGSSIEIVLGVLAFIALVTYLIAWDGALLDRLFGPDPPIPVVYLSLLILWDLTYRIGTSWWSAVVALWRAVHVDLSSGDLASQTARRGEHCVLGAPTGARPLPALRTRPARGGRRTRSRCRDRLFRGDRALVTQQRLSL